MKHQYLALLIVISMLAGYQSTSAQYNSAVRVNAGGDRALCGTNCFDLTVNLTDVRSTENYITDSSLGFNAHYPFYIPGSASLPVANNVFSASIPLQFSFSFYGKFYNNVAIGSNGIISFDEESAGKRCEPVIKNEIPARSYAYSAIMPAYEALDISIGGSIYYSTEGSIPNRKFIINYNNVSLKNCNNEKVTFQVILYETTNVIEIFLKDKPSCLYYHDGAAIAGIQNNHKQALSLPGKNANRWGSTGMNKAYRFIPLGAASIQLVQLSDINGTVLSSVQARSLENGQLSASFGKICVDKDNTQYVVSTNYNNNVFADTINITKSTDCGSVQQEPKNKPVVNQQDALHQQEHLATPEHELVINHVSIVNPVSCQGINGSIHLHGLSVNTTYSVSYSKNGIAQRPVMISSNAAGALSISKLSAGNYTDIKVTENGITSTKPGPYLLTDPEIPATPVAENNGPLNPGDKLMLTVSNEERVSYTWLGPGFAAVNNAPVILNAQPYNAGTYTVIATRNGCNSLPAKTTVAINNKDGIPNHTVPVRLNNYSKPGNGAPVRITLPIAVKQGSVKQIARPVPAAKKPIIVSKQRQVATQHIAKQTTAAKIYPVIAAVPGSVSQAPVAITKRVTPMAVRQNPVATTVKTKTIKKGPVKVYASSNSPVCAGNTLKLHAIAINGSRYSWSGPNNFTSNEQNPALNDIDKNASGLYTVRVTNENGISAVNTVPVQVSNVPVIDIKYHSDPEICYSYNGSITLSGFSSNKSYIINYSKNGVVQEPRTLIANNEGNIILDKLGGGEYSNIYTGTSKCGSNKVGPLSMSSPQPPQAPLAMNSGIAEPGDNVYLTASDIPGATYIWFGPNKFTSNEQNPALNNVTKKAAGTYTVIANVDGCNSEPATTTVIVKPAATGNITAYNAIRKYNNTEIGIKEQPKKKEYKGIVISTDNIQPGETITVTYDDPIREPSKVKWDFGDATIMSGSGNGPYHLSWSDTGLKRISLRLPFKLNGPTYPACKDSYTLCRDILVRYQSPAATEIQTIANPSLTELIKARHAEEESATMPSTVMSKPDQPVKEEYKENRNAASGIHTESINVQEDILTRREQESKAAESATVTKPIAVKPAVTKPPFGNMEPPMTEENIFISRANVCLNDTATISFDGYITDAASFKWDFAGGTIVSGKDAGPYVVRWDETGTKNIKLELSYGKEKTMLGLTAYIMPAPKAEFVIQADACPGETVSVENNNKERFETYTWDFDEADILNGDAGGPYEIKWEQTGKKVVSLTVKDIHGCTSLPYHEIINVHNDCCGISLPSAFTPNGDGKNDVFHVVSSGQHTILRFVVYNRFGREIFSTNNEGQGWDGTLNGTPQEIGTYTYKVRYRCGNKLYEKEGDVMLLR